MLINLLVLLVAVVYIAKVRILEQITTPKLKNILRIRLLFI